MDLINLHPNLLPAARDVAKLADRLLELLDYDPEIDKAPATEEEISSAKEALSKAIFTFDSYACNLIEVEGESNSRH